MIEIIVRPDGAPEVELQPIDCSFMQNKKKHKVVHSTVAPDGKDKNLWLYQMQFANRLGTLGHRTDALCYTFYVQSPGIVNPDVNIHRVMVAPIDGNTRGAIWYKNTIWIAELNMTRDGIRFSAQEQVYQTPTYTPLRTLIG